MSDRELTKAEARVLKIISKGGEYREPEASCCDWPLPEVPLDCCCEHVECLPENVSDSVTSELDTLKKTNERLVEAIKWLEDGLKPYAMEESWGTPDRSHGFGMDNHLLYEDVNTPGWTLAKRRLREARNVLEGREPEEPREDVDRTRGLGPVMERMQ